MTTMGIFGGLGYPPGGWRLYMSTVRNWSLLLGLDSSVVAGGALWDTDVWKLV